MREKGKEKAEASKIESYFRFKLSFLGVNPLHAAIW